MSIHDLTKEEVDLSQKAKQILGFPVLLYKDGDWWCQARGPQQQGVGDTSDAAIFDCAEKNGVWFSIEMRSMEFAVYRWDTYPESSVMAGQHRKSFIDMTRTEEDARRAYPTAVEGTQKRDPGNSVAHLPGEDDPVAGGMYPDDYA